MYGSLAVKNSADILVSLEYDGGEDNLHNLETATNRMTSAIRIMDNKERELKEKSEVTKSTLILKIYLLLFYHTRWSLERRALGYSIRLLSYLAWAS